MDNLTLTGYKSPQPTLAHNEIRRLIERKIHYEDIISKITHGKLKGTIHDLERIVQMVEDIQFKEGTVTLGRVTLPAEEVAHQVLQLHQHEVEFIVEAMAKHPNAPSSDEQLLASLYSTVSSWAALHHHSTQCR